MQRENVYKCQLNLKYLCMTHNLIFKVNFEEGKYLKQNLLCSKLYGCKIFSFLTQNILNFETTYTMLINFWILENILDFYHKNFNIFKTFNDKSINDVALKIPLKKHV